MTTFTRMRTCLTCGTQWESPVVHGPTFKLTGEITPSCIKCGSRAIASTPIPIVVEVDKGLNRVTRALQVLGFRDAQSGFTFSDDPIFKVTIKLHGDAQRLEFYLEQQQKEYHVLGSPIVRNRTQWVVSVEMTRPGTHWEPDFTDVADLCTGGSVESALIEAVLSYFRNTMYDSTPQENPSFDPLEDIPQ